jgi:hypothetical protein
MLESALTLYLRGHPELDTAHWKLYPERSTRTSPSR